MHEPAVRLFDGSFINYSHAMFSPCRMVHLVSTYAIGLVLKKVGKTKEQIYGSFRQTVLDIERLLLMRDNPPSPPDPLEWGSRPLTKSSAVESCESQQFRNSQTLSAEDLGMLLLHIHECRNILWESRRRFRSDVIRNVAEDLAELAGERGPVSVSQQLAIISRMSRTYPFMKVVSSGIPFDMIIPRAG